MQPGITFDQDAGRSSPHSAVGEGLDRDRLAEPRHESAQHEPIARGRSDPTIVDRQRPQNAHVHVHTVRPNPTRVKGTDIEPISAVRRALSR